MSDRELILQHDYKVDVILSLSNAYVTTENDRSLIYMADYFFSSKGIDVYKEGSQVVFVDKPKNLNIIYFDGSSLKVEIKSYKCADPSMVKLLKMKAKEKGFKL